MNIKDLPQGSYKTVTPTQTKSGTLNVKNLPQGSYKILNDTSMGGDTPAAPTANEVAQQKAGSAFQADPNGSLVGEAAKVVGNIPGSAFNFAKGAVDMVNPVSTVKKVADVAGAFSGLAGEKKAETQGNQNVADENNKLIEQYKTMRAAGKDTTHLETFAKQQGIDLTKVQVAKPTQGPVAAAAGELPGAAVTTLVPEAGRATGRIIQGAFTGNQQMVDENIQRAERAVVDDPVGQILPFIMAAEGGAKVLDRAGLTADASGAVERGISKTAAPVIDATKSTFGKVGDMVGGAKDFVAKAAGYAGRQATGINAETAQEFAKDPNLKPVTAEGLITKREELGGKVQEALASKKTELGVTPESLGQEVQSALAKRTSDLEDTGSAYGPVRSSGTEIKVDPNFLKSTIKETTGVDFKDGKAVTDASAKIRDARDVRAVQNFHDIYQPLFEKGKMTTNEFLNMRSDLAKLSKFERDIGKSTDLEASAQIMRGKLNTALRPQIEGLGDTKSPTGEVIPGLDTQFSTQSAELRSLTKGLVDKNGTLTDTGLAKIAKATTDKPQLLAQLEKVSPGISERIAALQTFNELGKGLIDENGNITDAGMKKITNAANEANPQMLAKLEQIKPGITKLIKQYKALQDVVNASEKFKVGTYGKNIGMAGVLGGIMTANPVLVGSAVAEMILTNPENAVKLIQTYAATKPIMTNIVAKLKGGVSRSLDTINKLPEKQPAMAGASVFGRTRQ